ncbi:MAG: LytR C-terminal domain-containing protein [Actinomycetes bacterium]
MSEQTPTRGVRRYPPDEFDQLPATQGRRGAHRARPNPVLAMVPVLLVVVAVVAVVVGAMTLLGDSAPDTASPAGNEAPIDEGTAAPEPSAPEGTAAPTQQPTAEPTTAPPPTEEPEPEPTVDRSVAVTVLNGTSTAGLAAGAAERLTGEGWTVAGTDNYRAGPTPPTTVYYASEDLAATAEAVAADLGGAATELSEAFGAEALTVVLGDDYRA